MFHLEIRGFEFVLCFDRFEFILTFKYSETSMNIEIFDECDR